RIVTSFQRGGERLVPLRPHTRPPRVIRGWRLEPAFASSLRAWRSCLFRLRITRATGGVKRSHSGWRAAFWLHLLSRRAARARPRGPFGGHRTPGISPREGISPVGKEGG